MVDGWMVRWVDGRLMNGGMDSEWMNGWVDGWADGLVGVGTERQTNK